MKELLSKKEVELEDLGCFQSIHIAKMRDCCKNEGLCTKKNKKGVAEQPFDKESPCASWI